MLIPMALLIAALVCFIVAAITRETRYGWAGLAVLTIYIILGAGKLV